MFDIIYAFHHRGAKSAEIPEIRSSKLSKFFAIVVSLLLLLAGCQEDEPAVIGFFPTAGEVSGWKPAEEARLYDRDTLYDLVNGQADAFFVYGFEQVAVRNYENDAGAVLGIEIWQVDSPANAYGLFTSNRAGESSDIGNDGDTDPRRRISFWQDRYYVRVLTRQEVSNAELRDIAHAVAAALPTGGEHPELVKRLPADGLVPRSEIFFHEELSIQNYLWLGGRNSLELSAKTDGVLARYEFDEAKGQLLLIKYPDAQTASDSLNALQSAQIEGLVDANRRDELLGAVFGQLDESTAKMLLSTVLTENDE